ncbi:short-chain dehydrogenase [Truncatella angustata]|uniref:Short-chain dehydrogenase n=1 Tax=Truncatella angustata TaxID=152316 RepID=A0A9P8UQP7_9PEZI|nr:short-chain dehydrogenase [Truncatella angustata]KAH6656446.1 short-chain dehydrogenase [Truncatella angustata]
MAPSRTVVVTGGTANLGYFAALQIAREHPEYAIILCSRTDKSNAAVAMNNTLGREQVTFLPLDLSDGADVRRFVDNFASRNYPLIQALLLNAALQFPAEMHLNGEGLESTFAINHVGHALLFHLLCPYLAQNARVVLTSSGTHDPKQKTGLPDAVYTTAEDLAHPPPASVNNPRGRQRYSTSKLCNVLWAYALATRLKERVPERGITVNAFCPGLMPGTGLAREGTGVEQFLWHKVLPRMIPLLRVAISPNIWKPEQSGANLARLATADDVSGTTGEYFEARKTIPSSEDSYDVKKQDDLWQWTIKYCANGDRNLEAKFESLK